MDDKRKFRRFPVNFPTHILRNSDDSSPIACSIIDVSAGGAGILLTEELPQDSLISLSWKRPPFDPGNPSLTIKGRIIGCRRKPAMPGKLICNMMFLSPEADVIQRFLRWAQMQSLVTAKSTANKHINSLLKTSKHSFHI
jgi:hypothetical protein